MPNRGQQQHPRGKKQPHGPGTFSPDDDETVDSEETLRQQAEEGQQRAERKKTDRQMEDQPEAGDAEEENERH